MHVSVVNFHLKGMTPEQFATECDKLAPAFAAVPGLISKIWLADPASNTYGGVYLWRNRQAMEQFAASELFAAVKSQPAFTGLTAWDFGILDGPTAVTRGLATVGV